jgi:phage FluMu gp28-like protein
MGITLKMRREMVQVERDVMKGLREDLRKIRAAMNQSRLNIKMHQEVLADERKFKRIVMMEQRTLRAAKRNEKRFAKIAAMEAKLAALKAAA